MSTWVADENLFKVRTADGENDFVALQQMTVACYGAIDKVAAIK